MQVLVATKGRKQLHSLICDSDTVEKVQECGQGTLHYDAILLGGEDKK